LVEGSLLMVSHVIGGVACAVLLWVLGFRRFMAGSVGLGSAAFLVSVFVQQPIQQVPILVAVLPEVFGGASGGNVEEAVRGFIAGLSPAMLVALALWLGFVAGAVQSSFKYIFARKRSLYGAANLGLGFGLAEAVFVGVIALASPLLTPSAIRDLPAYAPALSAFERFSAALFHVGSTLYITATARRGSGLAGLLAVVALHGSIDTLAALYQLTGAALTGAIAIAMAFAAGLALTARLYRKALEEAPGG